MEHLAGIAHWSERKMVSLAIALGAQEVPGWSAAEEALTADPVTLAPRVVGRVRNLIRRGQDPLGDYFCSLRSAAERRSLGATYTPKPIVASMLAWARLNSSPVRVVDVGAGSGRFLVAAGRAFRAAELVGVDVDPLAVLLMRGHLAAAGLANRARAELADYRELALPAAAGETLFIGNPPYVRHHLISPEWKSWLTQTAAGYGYSASQLAGLHVHFFLATREYVRRGDRVVFVTASEWLDVNYGKLVRSLFLGDLGGKSIHLVEPTAVAFPDAAATAVITCCEVGSRPKSIRLKRVESLAGLGVLQGGRAVRRERLEAARRWTPLTRAGRRTPEGLVELGELCQVHRGQVTGANRIWIAGPHSEGLPASVLFPCVTRARELLEAGPVLTPDRALRQVVDLPVDLEDFGTAERRAISAFLRRAKEMGGDKGFIAQHRKAWWSVGLRQPAVILTTYMARRSPAFVVNQAEARHINIAHGIYPREPMSGHLIQRLAAYLATTTSVVDGRTYAGGLTKFEPKEMERLLVPSPDALAKAE